MPWVKVVSAGFGVPFWTAVLAVALVGYLHKFGSNVPVGDEWDVAPQLRQVVRDGEVPRWLFFRHNEHYYPLARAVYAAAMVASGYDFRSGMVASTVALGVAALLFASAARRLRGHSCWADLVIPALLLNWGAGDNVTMGYQVAFTLEVLASAFAVWVVASDRGGRRWDVAATFALIVLALNGVAGLLTAAPFLGWVLSRSGPGRGSWPWRVAVTCLPAAAVVAYGLWATIGGDRGPGPAAAINSPEQFARVAGQFLAMGFGTRVTTSEWVVPAALALAVYGGSAVVLVRSVVARPADRPAAVGMAAILLGVFGMAAGVAWGRGGGLVERYASLSAVGLATAWLVLSRSLPRSTLVNGAGVVAAVALFAANVTPGDHFGQVRRMYCRELEASVREGLPASCVADRFRGPVFDHDRFRDRLDALRDLGFTTFDHLPAEPATATVVAPVPAGGVISAPVALPLPAGNRKVFAVRVRYETATDIRWQQLAVAWTGGDGTRRKSAVYPSLRRGPQSSTFSVNDSVTAAHFEVVCPDAGVSVVGVEWLLFDAPPAGVGRRE